MPPKLRSQGAVSEEMAEKNPPVETGQILQAVAMMNLSPGKNLTPNSPRATPSEQDIDSNEVRTAPSPSDQQTDNSNQNDAPATKSDIEGLRTLIQGLVKTFEDHKSYVDRRLDEVSNGLKDHFKSQMEDLHKHVDTEISQVVSRLDSVETRMLIVENDTKRGPFDPEVSIIATNMEYQADEDIEEKASDLVRTGLSLPEDVCPVVRALRLPDRNVSHGRPRPGNGPTNRPPLVKIEFRSLEEKKMALRNKENLKNSTWHRTWIRSSKPHVERLIDINFKTILDMLPNGKDMKVTGSGRIVPRNENNNR